MRNASEFRPHSSGDDDGESLTGRDRGAREHHVALLGARGYFLYCVPNRVCRWTASRIREQSDRPTATYGPPSRDCGAMSFGRSHAAALRNCEYLTRMAGARQSVTWNARMYLSRLSMRKVVTGLSSRSRKIGPHIGMSAVPCDGRGRWPSNVART